MLVLKWFLSTLKQQYSSRNEKLGSEKKPLNPFLGELFLGQWQDEAGTTELISEQVSHHPPVTAYSIWNQQSGVRLEGYNAQKASFGHTINVKQIGHAMLHIDQYDESYLITLPAIHIESLLVGKPYVELEKSTYIVSSSGYTSKIDYSGKGWLRGKQNSMTATMTKTGSSKNSEVLYTVEGQWIDSFVIKDAQNNVVESYDAKTSTKTPLIVKPVEAQDPLESRRAWSKVAAAIESGDMNLTSQEKTFIEESQRALRRKEQETGIDWQRRYFVSTTPDSVYESLSKAIGEDTDVTKTNGHWLFSPEKSKGMS